MPTAGGRQEPYSEENQGAAWHLKTAMKVAAEAQVQLQQHGFLEKPWALPGMPESIQTLRA
jgi:hypothetical protein